MPDITADQLPLTSPDLTAELLAHLHEVAPQVFCEGKVDFDKLKAVLGATLDERAERYGLSWAGKSEAFRNVQIPSVATLLPQLSESVAWDTTENQIIEGDNLEVLKLLQKPYHGKIKMIYIDPPYNTGNEFIYPDNYREGLKDYLRYSGQVSEEGAKQSTNTETSGRFHSNWLSMMYPRLFLARNLLCEDGLIFVSIDDNEVHNLRLLMDEVFGEENFICLINVVSNPRGRQSELIATTHEYLIGYARNASACVVQGQSLSEAQMADFKHKTPNNEKYRIRGLRHRGNASRRIDRPKMYFPIYVDPVTREVSLERSNVFTVEVVPKKSSGEDGRWEWGKETVKERLNLLEAVFIQIRGEWDIFQREFLLDIEGNSRTTKWKSVWDEKEINYQNGKNELKSLFDESPFEYPKPTHIIRKIVEGTCSSDDLILDFFAGSGTTAQAVLELNKEDGGNRRFILVQLPEKTENPKFPTITHITRERVRRVIVKLDKEDAGKLDLAEKQDRGFRAFKLTSSNFKIWDADNAPTDIAALAEQLKLYADNVEDSRDQQDILFELILKAGRPLSSRIATIDVAGGTAYSVDDGKLLVCLENPVTRDMLRAMTALKPSQMLCLDTAFHGDDALKTNTVLEARAHGVVFRTV